MYSITLSFLLLSLLGSGCYCHIPPQKVSPTPTTIDAPQNPPSLTEKISPITVSSVSTQEPSVPQKTLPKTTPQEVPPQKNVSVRPKSASTPSVAPTEPSAPPASSTPTDTQKRVPPAPDSIVFDKEPLLDLSARHLNPLAQKAPVPDTNLQAPWKGEQLKFGLYYSFVKVGTAYIKNRGIIDVNGHPAYVLQTTAFSAPVIDAVFKVRDINLSWLDAHNFSSLGYSQSLREGNYQRDEWVTFDYAQKEYRGELHKKTKSQLISGALPTKVLDILTALYFVRAQVLIEGKAVVFDVLNREEQYPLIVNVIKRETIKTPAGKFNCIVVEPQIRGEGIFVRKGTSLQVWLTDDDKKMPVKMKTEVFIGSVSAELVEYKVN